MSEPGAPLRVLLVDDDAAVLSAYRRMLGRRFRVEVAAGGREALELLERDRDFDAIVCDVMMPDVDGAAVWGVLTERYPELARRTAFCTGGACTARAVAFTEAVQDRLLAKPFEPEDLVRFVARVAAGR